MREFLFRGKRKNNDEWIEGYLVKLGKESFSDPERYGICEKAIPIGGSGVCYNIKIDEVIPETAGQFTGLTDKNGKKIFEGDFVATTGTFDHRIYEVRFSEARRGWFPFACGDGCGCCEDEVEYPEYVEIIGNKWDNKDLLEDKE